MLCVSILKNRHKRTIIGKDLSILMFRGAAGYFYRKSKTQAAVVQYQTFTDDDVPRLDVGTTTQYRDDAESEDDDMLA